MAYSSTGAPHRPVWVRLLRAAPLLILLIEVVLVIVSSRLIGWWTLLLLLALSVAGVAVVSRTSRRSWRELREMRRTGRAPERRAGDAVINLVGGGLLALPGYFTALLGLILLVPASHGPVRSLARFLASRGALRVPGVRVYGGAGRSPFGDVVPGQVERDEPTRPPSGRPDGPEDPPVIEGRIVDK
ncbi:FxsA family protein [Luteipulveratus sp. YIM 133132]|uniref:FxsA family protein n=1 Tax=Luteipulveratus flavus TaxID=3031728 RepID=UPI0023B0B3BD|nr:FxsA family protein [Luteipulveratus sp. YIM 133132]MDE9367404.1 FxsA family protein [Luteipulveratus sp. YIM 133132]